MPALPSSAFRERIEFERSTAVRSRTGPEVRGAFESLGFARARVSWGTGQERRQAGAEGAAQTATFRCRAVPLTNGVVVTDRIRFAGMTWDVTGIAPLATSPAEIEFTATASRG